MNKVFRRGNFLLLIIMEIAFLGPSTEILFAASLCPWFKIMLFILRSRIELSSKACQLDTILFIFIHSI